MLAFRAVQIVCASSFDHVSLDVRYSCYTHSISSSLVRSLSSSRWELKLDFHRRFISKWRFISEHWHSNPKSLTAIPLHKTIPRPIYCAILRTMIVLRFAVSVSFYTYHRWISLHGNGHSLYYPQRTDENIKPTSNKINCFLEFYFYLKLQWTINQKWYIHTRLVRLWNLLAVAVCLWQMCLVLCVLERILWHSNSNTSFMLRTMQKVYQIINEAKIHTRTTLARQRRRNNSVR